MPEVQLRAFGRGSENRLVSRAWRSQIVVYTLRSGTGEKTADVYRAWIAASDLHHLPTRVGQEFRAMQTPQSARAFCSDPTCQSEIKLVGDAGNTSEKISQSGEKCQDECCPITTETRAVSASLPLVRLAGPDVVQKAGIAVVPAASASLSPTITANGEVGYDETHLAHVRPRVSGVISEILIKPGDTVRRGQVLAMVDSAELGQAKADYLSAQPLAELSTKTLSRHQGLDQQGIVAGKQVFEAQAELQRAQAELLKAAQRIARLRIRQPANGDSLARK